MIDALKKLFTDEHEQALDQLDAERAAFAKQDADFAAQLDALANKPVGKIRELDDTRAEIAKVQEQRDRAAINHRIAEGQLTARARATAPAALDEALRRLLHERERTAKALVSRPFVERVVGGIASGKIETNGAKIHPRLAAIDAAVQSLDRLKVERVADIAAAMRQIQAAIPPFDDETEFRDAPAAALIRA